MRNVAFNINLPGSARVWMDGITDLDPDGEKVRYGAIMVGDGRLKMTLPDCSVIEKTGFNCRVTVSGYKDVTFRIPVPPVGNTEGAALGVPFINMEPSVLPFPQGAVRRAPLAPFPPGEYDRDLWFTPPTAAEKRYWRANFGCVEIPNLPWIPGMEEQNYNRVLTGFYGRYAPAWRDVIGKEHVKHGFTHFLRWVQDELLGAGVSIQAYVDQCKELKDNGMTYVAHSFLSKTFAPQSPGSQYCHEQFDALIDALQKANVLDLYTVGFELNAFTNDPASNDACIDYFAVERGLTEANGVPGYVHFFPGYTWQGTGARDRRTWWDMRRFKLTGLLYQSDPAWDIRMAQDRYKDTTDNAGEGFVGTDSGFGHEFDFVALETQLQRTFGNRADLNEDDLDQMGFLSCCTHGGVPVMGYGCGARRPDGSYL